MRFLRSIQSGFTAVCLYGLACIGFPSHAAESSALPAPGISLNAKGQLTDQPNPQGDRIPDFSSCGYHQGEEPPLIETVQQLTPQPNGDDTQRLQQAIDALAKRPLNAQGFRGALLLKAGEYRIAGTLLLNASGIVLRGEGPKTLLRATGTKPRALIQVGGGSWKPTGPQIPISTTRTPVGACELTLESVANLKVGQSVSVTRQGNAEWIHELGMDRIPGRQDGGKTLNWSPFALSFDRHITAIQGNRVQLDAPIVCAIEKRWGGGYLQIATDTRLEHIGVENLSAISDYDPAITAKRGKQTYPSDEQHAEYLVSFAQVRHAWARGLVTRHFAHGPARIASGKWISILNCQSLEPVSQIEGGRRYPFCNSGGQLCLFQHCLSDQARHAFVYGARVVGPNVFLRCRSTHDYVSSEPHHRWSTGGLYDQCETPLAIVNRSNLGSGHGWSGANFVVWNSRGTIRCESPPTAWNAVFGHQGSRQPGPFKSGDATWISFGTPLNPPSLYDAQRTSRLANQ